MDPGHLVLCVVAHDGAADLWPGLIHGKDQPLWKGSFDDITRHLLLLSLAGGERCTSTLSKKGYSRWPLSTSGVLPILGLRVPYFGNDAHLIGGGGGLRPRMCPPVGQHPRGMMLHRPEPGGQ